MRDREQTATSYDINVRSLRCRRALYQYPAILCCIGVSKPSAYFFGFLSTELNRTGAEVLSPDYSSWQSSRKIDRSLYVVKV